MSDFNTLVDAAIEREPEEPQWHWFSFADDRFRGLVIHRCRGVVSGSQELWDLGINPGGQVACWALPDLEPPEWVRDRLFDKRQAALLASIDPALWETIRAEVEGE